MIKTGTGFELVEAFRVEFVARVRREAWIRTRAHNCLLLWWGSFGLLIFRMMRAIKIREIVKAPAINWSIGKWFPSQTPEELWLLKIILKPRELYPTAPLHWVGWMHRHQNYSFPQRLLMCPSICTSKAWWTQLVSKIKIYFNMTLLCSAVFTCCTMNQMTQFPFLTCGVWYSVSHTKNLGWLHWIDLRDNK